METISPNDRTMQLPEGATGEPIYSSFWFLWEPPGGQGRSHQSLGFAMTSFYLQRGHRAMPDLNYSVCSSNSQFCEFTSWQVERVLSCVRFWNIISSSQAPDLVELKSCRGSRKCCVWCSFSVNVGVDGILSFSSSLGVSDISVNISILWLVGGRGGGLSCLLWIRLAGLAAVLCNLKCTLTVLVPSDEKQKPTSEITLPATADAVLVASLCSSVQY